MEKMELQKRMMERRKNKFLKKKDRKGWEEGWINMKKNMEKKRQKKKIFCILTSYN